MRITRLKVENFRGIKVGELLIPSHAVMVGDNNIGKSSLLEAIDLVLGPERLSRRPVIDEHDFYAGRYIDGEGQPVSINVEVIVADLLPCLAAFAETVVEGSVQMVVRFPDLDDVPGMAVFDALFRVIAAERDHAPDAERITKNFDRFGDALADADALSQRSDDLMGVGLF